MATPAKPEVVTSGTYCQAHSFLVRLWLEPLGEGCTEWRGQANPATDNAEDDFFLFNRLEVPSLIEDVTTAWALGENIPTLKRAGRAAKRKKILEAAAKRQAPPALGVPPEVVAEPFTVMLWGSRQSVFKTGYAPSSPVKRSGSRALPFLPVLTLAQTLADAFLPEWRRRSG